jgi:hypothetical protein
LCYNNFDCIDREQLEQVSFPASLFALRKSFLQQSLRWRISIRPRVMSLLARDMQRRVFAVKWIFSFQERRAGLGTTAGSLQQGVYSVKPDSMLVEPKHIVSARQDVATKGSGPALHEFAQAEPALASFIYEGLASVAGKLSLSGAPTELVQGSHEDLLAVVLTCVQAMRHGHYALWKDTVTGTRLAQLDPSFQPKHPRRRKKPEDGGSTPQAK